MTYHPYSVLLWALLLLGNQWLPGPVVAAEGVNGDSTVVYTSAGQDPDASSRELLQHAWLLRDPGGELRLGDVLAAGDEAFTPLQGSLSLGYTREAAWLRLDIALAAPGDEAWWLVVWPPFIDDLRLYVPDVEGHYREFRAGDRIPVPDRYLAVRETVFPLELDTQPRRFYLRVQSTSTLALSLELMTPETFAERAVLNNTRHGLFMGLLLTAILVSLLSALWLRQAVFFAATAYLVAYGCLHFVLNGYDQLLVYPHQTWLADRATGVLGTLTAAFLILFVLSYLEPKPHARRLHGVLLGLAWLCLFWALLSALGLYPWIAPLFQGFALLILVLLIVLMFRMLRHNRTHATLLLIMFLPSLLAVLAQVLRNLGILPTGFWTTHLWEITTFLQIPFAAVVVLLRVREEERKHRVAQEREKAQRGLLNMIAHELRTPLSVLDAAVANLEARTDSESPDLRPRFQRIHGALARLNSLVDNALAEDRLQQGGMQLDIQPVAPSVLLQQVQELMAGGDGRHDLRIRFPDDDSPVSMDPHWLGLALINLLDNAIKYSPGGGRIELDMTRHGGQLEFRVRDEGIGIPADALAQLGTRFYRADNARGLPGVRGLGLGLFLVREVACRHGGSLHAESALGQGSVFILRIPAAMPVS